MPPMNQMTSLFHTMLSLSMNLCCHLCMHVHTDWICACYSNKITIPSFYFPPETTVVATGDQETENKTGQYGKSPNFFVTISTNASLYVLDSVTDINSKHISKVQHFPFYILCVCRGERLWAQILSLLHI